MAKQNQNRRKNSGGRQSGNAGAPKMTAAEKKQAEAEAKREAERIENARKSRMMGNVFLYAFLAIIAVFCLYTLIKTLFFPAASISEMRTNYLFISLVAIPYLIATAAVVVRKLRKKQRTEASSNIRRAENLVFLVVLLTAALMFGLQMLTGRQDSSGHPAYTAVCEALESTGQEVRQAEEVPGFRSMLETLSLQTELHCGQTGVVFHYHNCGAGIAGRFRSQTARDYAAGQPVTEEGESFSSSVWPLLPDRELARTAVCVQRGGTILILELHGPEAEVEALLPVLKEAAEKIQGK